MSADEPQMLQFYAFRAANKVPEETTRLDELHEGVAAYLDNRLSFAPLEGTNPQKILELGSGSGAWAIQAAKTFPDAQVLAVDISELPSRTLPVNLTFQKVDLTRAFPFANDEYDVVHARLVIMHLPNGEDVLQRTFELVKPGGWLLVEEPDDDNMCDGGKPLGPGMKAFVQAWFKVMRSRGVEPSIGRLLEGFIKKSGAFNEIHVKKVTIPLSGKSEDPIENQLGKTWVTTMRRVAPDLPVRFGLEGITPELVQNHLGELADPGRSLTTDMYFTWSRRHAL